LTGRGTAHGGARVLATLGGGLVAALVVIAIVSGCGANLHPGNSSACRDKAKGMPKLTWGIPTPDPRAVVILLHGGGWQPNPTGYRQQVTYAKAIEAGGVATVAVGYGPGAIGFRQIEDVYQTARQCFPDAPICAVGDSAGGNLALVLAAREPDLSCVIARAAPTDLTSLQSQGGTEAHQLAVDAFGEGGLNKYSPVRQAGAIKAPVLLIMAQNDPLVPVEQGTELKRALPATQLMVLPPGPVPFVHGLGVTQSSLQQSIQRETSFLQQASPLN
jgi:acetyl esterase/lipase